MMTIEARTRRAQSKIERARRDPARATYSCSSVARMRWTLTREARLRAARADLPPHIVQPSRLGSDTDMQCIVETA